MVCVRSDAIPETWKTPAEADEEGQKKYSRIKAYMEQGTVLGRLPTLREVAEVAVFAASGRASAMSGAILNATCGSIPD